MGPLVLPFLAARYGIPATKVFLKTPLGKKIGTKIAENFPKIADTVVGSGSVAYVVEKFGLDKLFSDLVTGKDLENIPEEKRIDKKEERQKALEEARKNKTSATVADKIRDAADQGEYGFNPFIDIDPNVNQPKVEIFPELTEAEKLPATTAGGVIDINDLINEPLIMAQDPDAGKATILSTPPLNPEDQLPTIYTMGPAPKFLQPAADKWLQNNPDASLKKTMEVFLNEPDKYLKTGTVNINNIKDRRKALGITTPEGQFINRISKERKENTFTDFKSNLENIDINDSQAVLDVFRNSYKKGYAETTAAKQYEETGSLTTSQSANSQINELIDQFENTEGGFKILKQKEIDSLIPKTSANKAREVRESFKKFLVEAPQYKEIIKAYPGEAEYLKRYFNFIRESSLKKNRNPIKGKESSISPKQVNFDNFIKEYEVEFNDMLNPNSSFAKEYQEFKRVDVVRGKVSKLLQPFFDKVFPSGGKKSVQIAHRYMGSQIGNTVPAGVAGSGGSPMAYDLDLSMINYNIQPKLEELARRAVKNNDKKAMQDISSDATAIGAEFEINGIKFGEFRPLEEVIDNLIAEAMIDGKKIGLTDKMINDAMEASNMLRLEVGARQNLKDGGIVGINHLTRPLGNF